jgi:hypothetical protein
MSCAIFSSFDNDLKTLSIHAAAESLLLYWANEKENKKNEETVINAFFI